MPVIDLKNKKQKQSAPVGYRMAKNGARGEIYLYGVIGDSFFSDGVTAKQFSADLKELGDVSALDIRINSEGGDVFQGRSIYNLLNEHKAKITVHVDGWAASIASLIAMAGDEIIMGDGAYMMIHNPWGYAVGESGEMRRVADLLDSIAGTMIDTYAARTGSSRDDIKKWMDAETTMTAEESVERGFADSVVAGARIAAIVRRPESFKNLPLALRPNRARAQALVESVAPSK